MRIKTTTFLLIFQLFPFVIFSQTPYTVNKTSDPGLVISGISILGVGYYFNYKVTPLTLEQINQLNKNDINSFDRSAANNWSPNLSRASDVLVLTIEALPVLFMSSKKMKSDYKKLAVLYFETMTFSIGTNLLFKGLFKRTRPFVYNPDAPLSKKLEVKARKSFYSGHTTMAFASAVFTAKVFNDYFPNSKWKNIVWITSLAGASAVAYLRFESGQHFPSDVFAGAVTGSLAGYLVPHLHKNKKNQITFFTESSPNFYYFNVSYNF